MTQPRPFRLLAAAAMVLLFGCGRSQQHGAPTPASSLAKLKSETTAKPVPPVSFVDDRGSSHDLAAFKGRYVLLNLWATWCAPCVRELPALSHLQAAVDARKLVVVPVNVGRDKAAATAAFLKQHNAELPVYIDTKSAFLHAFGATGLPLTLLIDPKGEEIARASGAVRWDAKDSIAYFKSLDKE
ncbi:MAG TPA: TlpA disulfide reductase family protein [Rhizomicrobium sp.]